MKFREVIRILRAHGFELDRQNGSHRQFEAVIHGKRRLVTVAGALNDDVLPKTLSSIIRTSGLSRKTFN